MKKDPVTMHNNYNLLIMTLINRHTFFFKQFGAYIVISLCLLFISGNLYAKPSYIKCWKNAEGLTECGNRIPREYYNQKIRYIDNEGVTRKIKEKGLTREELATQHEEDKLLALETEKKRKSDNYDEVLLKTYLTIDDLLASLNSKLDIIKSQSVILDSNIELRKRQFANLVRQAADMERSGKKISHRLSTKLDSTRKSLRNLQSQVEAQEVNIKKIKSVFAHDVERFLISKLNSIQNSLSTPSQAKKLHAVRLSCLNQSQCQSHREKAIHFINEFATTNLLYSTDTISVTDIPLQANDIAMSFVILDNGTDTKKVMVFQVRCNPERQGQEFCAGDEVQGILREFKSIIYTSN